MKASGTGKIIVITGMFSIGKSVLAEALEAYLPKRFSARRADGKRKKAKRLSAEAVGSLSPAGMYAAGIDYAIVEALDISELPFEEERIYQHIHISKRG